MYIEGSYVKTDQGDELIENLSKTKHTINKMPISRYLQFFSNSRFCLYKKRLVLVMICQT